MTRKMIQVFIGGGDGPVIFDNSEGQCTWNHWPTPAELDAMAEHVDDLMHKGKVTVRPFLGHEVGWTATFLPETGLWGRILRWAARELLKWRPM